MAEVKEALGASTDIPTDQLVMTFKGKVLADSDTPVSLGMLVGDQLELKTATRENGRGVVHTRAYEMQPLGPSDTLRIQCSDELGGELVSINNEGGDWTA
eukprot:Sspe_Gene.45858::Locus_22770_Transcript_2_5_Confidence_0.500_Length_609::g.45858::m.45858